MNINDFLECNKTNIELEKDMLRNHAYLTKNLFHNSKLKNDEQFTVLLKHLHLFDTKNPFLGGVITNICYRVAEDYDNRSFIIDHLISIKSEYDRKVDLSHPINTRWLLSSTNTLSTLILATGRVDEAKKILEKGLRRYSLGAHTPLINQNLAMIYIQYAMIKFSESRLNLSSSIFEKCLYHCSNSLHEIHNSRNNFFSSMLSDCQNIVEISKSASTGIALRKGKQIGSRTDIGNNITTFSSKVITSRFFNNFIKEHNWHLNKDIQINKHLDLI